MYLKIACGWFAEENRGKTADLDKALQDCLDEFGFYQTEARFDMNIGERSLEFQTEESVIRDVIICLHCEARNPQDFLKCRKCKKTLKEK